MNFLIVKTKSGAKKIASVFFCRARNTNPNFKKVLAVLALFALFFAVAPHFTHAQYGPSGSGYAPPPLYPGQPGYVPPVAPKQDDQGWLGKIGEQVGSAMMNAAYTLFGKIFYFIGYLLAFIGGVAVAILAWIIGVMLNLNNGIVQSDAVQVGFSIALSVANLGFVLGIIVIAIATILRSASYGLKQILWKLVVAAILVNFSLVIVAPILNFSNQLTQYFLNCATGSCSQSGGNSIDKFSRSLAGAFNPQSAFLLGMNTTTSTTVIADSNQQGAFSLIGSTIGKMLIPIVSIFFIGIMLSVINITLVTFVLMLFIRYLTLGILIIIMPFAWLFWIFPNLSHHWTKWWNTFWRWTLFAPIVIFFLYLAMITSNAMSNGAGGPMTLTNYTQPDPNTNSAFAALGNLFGSLFSPLLEIILKQLLVVGLAVGGLFAANSMSIHGADAGMKAIKSVRNATVGYVSGQAKKGARAAYRGIGGKQITSNLQQGKVGAAAVAIPTTISRKLLNFTGRLTGQGKLGDKAAGYLAPKVQQGVETLKQVPGAGVVTGVAKGIAKYSGASILTGRLSAMAGRGIANIEHNKDLVDEAKKHVPEDKNQLLHELEGPMRRELQLAYIAKGMEKKWIDADTKVGTAGEKLVKFKDSHEDDFNNYGQSKLSKDLDKILNGTKETRELENRIEEGAKPGQAGQGARFIVGAGGVVRDEKILELEKKKREFYEGFDPGDEKLIKVNQAFGKNASQIAIESSQRVLAAFAPKLVSGIMNKMDSTTLAKFQPSYYKQIEQAKIMVKEMSDLTQEEKNALLLQLAEEDTRFKKRLNNIALGYESYEESGTGAPTPSPTPPPPPAGP